MNSVLLPRPVAVALSVTLVCSGARSEELPDRRGERSGPVLHYTFDSRRGEVVANQAGPQHAGWSKKASFTNPLSTGTTLIVRKNELQSGYIETADHKDLNSPAFTVAAWIKLRRSDSNGSVVCKHDWTGGKARGYVLRCYTSKCIDFTIGAGGWVRANGTTRVPANQWVHVAGTFDGKRMKVFFNGRLEGTTVVERDYTPSPLPLRIGHAAFKLEKKRKFDGRIDDAMFWTRALSEKQLRAVYDDQKKSRPRPLTAADVAPIVKRLGSARFKDRVDAQMQLIELDTEVLPLLEPHRQNDDSEIVGRLNQIKRIIDRDLLP